jgi:hypothetical protein
VVTARIGEGARMTAQTCTTTDDGSFRLQVGEGEVADISVVAGGAADSMQRAAQLARRPEAATVTKAVPAGTENLRIVVVPMK